MAKKYSTTQYLVIVESPAKSKTIEKLLGSNYIVLSSFGHIRNLDKKNLGIDVDNNFKPVYKILSDRSKQIKVIQETIKKVDNVLLASDEDREGEAIAWHCAIVFKLKTDISNRICFHEITKSALEHAVANPRKINMSLVYSQQARRILDRLVGFKLSPLLWKYIAPKLSAGRVQSAALKVLIDQEKEISKHLEKKYYKTIGIFNKNINSILNTNFESLDNINIFLNDCKEASFLIKNINKKTNEKRPPPPYTTSSIQQDIGTRFNISSKKIMGILQKLYENGLITYHRTDSTNLSTHIQDEIKNYIIEKHTKKYLHARTYKSKIKCAQEAHEAIRPTHIDTEELNDTYDSIEKKIYNLIWKRTVASQMSAQILDLYTITISISNRKELFITKVEKVIFDGYKKIYDDTIKKDDSESSDDEILLSSDFIIDNIKENDILKYNKITSTEKNQIPPPRYTESSLIKKMEKIGIGRPSTYSNIIETIIERKYVEKKDIKGKKVDITVSILEKDNIKNKVESITFGAEKKKLVPTDLGITTTQFLESNFNDILDVNFTSNLEEKLDDIANSTVIWHDVISDFYNLFIPNVEKLDDKKLISKNYNDKKRLIGNNKEGIPVYTYIAKYGPVLQVGEGADIKYIKLDSKYSISTVTINDYNEITKYPKKIGSYQDKDINIKNGMYGYYISYNDKNYKFLENMDENLSLEDAINCIENNANGVNSTTKSSLLNKIDKYTIKTGQYGPYIEYEKKFYNIPKEYDIEKLTKEICDTIIKLPKKTYKKK
jgi:DNA topoisomerase-1